MVFPETSIQLLVLVPPCFCVVYVMVCSRVAEVELFLPFSVSRKKESVGIMYIYHLPRSVTLLRRRLREEGYISNLKIDLTRGLSRTVLLMQFHHEMHERFFFHHFDVRLPPCR
jgi:hypothetical protein